MKTNFFATCVIACSLLLNHNLHAQTSSANNNPGGGKYLGYNGPQDIDFRTNNTTRMRLMQNGSLGIGASNYFPGALLHANLLSFSSTDGNVFRTDAHHNQNINWSMYSGTNLGNSFLKARFMLNPGTLTQNNSSASGMTNDARNHLVVESTNGDVVLQARGANGGGIKSQRLLRFGSLPG